MKISNSVTAFYLAVTAMASTVYSATAAQYDATPVMINVRCPGVDFGGSLSLGQVAGNALADSYSSVHSHADNDDSELEGLSFRGTNKASFTQLEHGKSITAAGEWSGKWTCNVCPDDDNTSALKAWENEFVARLVESSVHFENVKTCDIRMVVVSETVVNAPNVDISVKCNNANFHQLSVAKGTFLAHAVQVSYKKAHQDNPHDDSHLDHVVYQGDTTTTTTTSATTNKQLLKKTSWWDRWYHHHSNTSPSMTGDYSCEHCPDGRKADFVVGATGTSARKAWEAELVAALTEGPIVAFHDISSCDIVMRPHSVAVAQNTSINCGLRVCTE